MTETLIEWADQVWNPTRGCALISPGCENCYAMRQAHRFSGPGGTYEGLTKLTKKGPVWTGEVRFIKSQLAAPFGWSRKKPTIAFVDSMSDLFHDSVSNEQIAAVFGVMAATPWHTYQVLTKRSHRMREWFDWVKKQEGLVDGPGGRMGALDPSLVVLEEACNHEPSGRYKFEFHRPTIPPWPLPNVWIGVSIENDDFMDRASDLAAIPATVRFLSLEPLLGDLGRLGEALSWPEEIEDDPLATWALFDAIKKGHGDGPRRIHWVIAGGESGFRARDCDVDGIRAIVRVARENGTACFVKQLGKKPFDHPEPLGPRVLYQLRHKKGGDWSEWTPDLRVRQMPVVKDGRVVHGQFIERAA